MTAIPEGLRRPMDPSHDLPQHRAVNPAPDAFTRHSFEVMHDADFALLYGLTTKALNQAVKRNRDRFPFDFMFELRPEEKEEVVTICDHLSRLRFSYALPHAFTEHGVLMRANVLDSGVGEA